MGIPVTDRRSRWFAVLSAAAVADVALVVLGRPDLARAASALAFAVAAGLCLLRARRTPAERAAWLRFGFGAGIVVLASSSRIATLAAGLQHPGWTVLPIGVVVLGFLAWHLGLVHWDRSRRSRPEGHETWTAVGGFGIVMAWLELWATSGGPSAGLPLGLRIAIEVPVAACTVLLLAAVVAPTTPGLRRDPRGWLVAASVVPFLVVGVSRLAGATSLPWTPAVGVLAAVALGAAAALDPRPHPPLRPAAAAGSWASYLLLAQAVVVLTLASPVTAPITIGLALLAVGTSALRLAHMARALRELNDVRRWATTDELTGVANRRALLTRIEEVTHRGDQVCLAVLDVDDFGTINDGLGQAGGDELLVAVAQRLQGVLKGTCLLGRVGGDEFAVVAAAPPGEPPTDPAELGPRLSGALAEPFTIAGLRLHLTAAIGLTASTDDDAGLLFERAEAAMRESHRLRSGPVLHDPQRHGDTSGTLALVQELRAGLEADELVLFMQPQIDLHHDLVDGVEALVRWQHPTRGLLGPFAFLPAAEAHGLIGALTERVVEVAIRQLAAWRADGVTLRMSVNLSATNLLDEALAERIHERLVRYGVPPTDLVLEITENVFVGDSARVRTTLDQLRGLGCELSIDDYGTGWSSLGYLRQLPVQELKLDRSFTVDLLEDPRAQAIVGSTIDLAHTLGLRVVAEGVEDAETAAQLVTLGCDLSQGYWHARPMPAHEVAGWLDQRSAALLAPLTGVPA